MICLKKNFIIIIISKNYYNKKKEIYLDFNDKMGDICGYILDSIGLCQNNFTEIYKRKEKNQTTKNIIENPMIENHFVFYVDEYVFLEYKNKKINISSDKISNISNISGIDFGLKDGEEIALKLNEKIIQTRALKEDLSIRFRQGNGKINIICKEDELMSEIINRFRIKTGYNCTDYNFIYNFKDIVLSATLAEHHIQNAQEIQVMQTELISGGSSLGRLYFADIRTGKIKKLKFSENAPKWRYIKKGLNIFGICDKNKECEAYKKEVIHIVGLDSDEKKLKFDLRNEARNIKCPMCNRIIKIKTCGFYECEFQFIGKKEDENGEEIDYESEPKETQSDDFEYFDPNDNGETEWFDLIIYVLPKQEIKYEKI